MIRWLCLGLIAGVAGQAWAADAVDQRQLYKQAVAALDAGEAATADAVVAKLHDYPLYPYLRYYRLRDNLAEASDEALEHFLSDYAGTPVAWRLRGDWLKMLAAAGRWEQFLKVYDHRPDVGLKCYYLRARVRAGELDGVAASAKKLWLVGHSQPRMCDRLFDWLQRTGQITSRMVWRRIDLAMTNDQPGLAKYLADRLDQRDRQWVGLWRKVHRDPAAWLASDELDHDTMLVRKIVADGIEQLIVTDLDQAQAMWQRIRHRYAPGRAIQNRIDRKIALYAALRYHPQAAKWLSGLDDSARDEITRQWAVRTAVRDGNWPAVVKAIHALSASQQSEPQWRYWLARAYGEIGRSDTARALYQQLASMRSYYGFLAADRIGRRYVIGDRPLKVDADAIAALEQKPGIRRARELLAVDDLIDARREWNWATADMGSGELKVAAVLADRWGWYDTAIRTIDRAGEFDDISLRFPTPYAPAVDKAASRNRLSRAWVYGIMRRESGFMVDARSRVGAIGLMQLMPATARHIARVRERPRPAKADLLQGPQNIALGGAYLRYLLDVFGGNRVLAIAAYNAGPERVDDWLPVQRRLSADQWVESIPYPETRKYVRAVLAYTEIFRWALGDADVKLSSTMTPIEPKAEIAATGSVSSIFQ